MARLRVQGKDTVEGGIVAQFTSSELVQIRKIWDIGTDQIVVQTVIQLDGDVVTRLKPDVDEEEEHITLPELNELHERSVKLSVAFWDQLIGILKDFFENIIERFFVGS